MPRARKLTIAAAEALAKKADPEAWNAMSPSQRREVVDRVDAQHASVWAADTALRKMLPKIGKKR
jgi:hypothetical protein